MLLRPTISWGFAPRREQERRRAQMTDAQYPVGSRAFRPCGEGTPCAAARLAKVLTFSYQILRHVDIDPGIF
jgi:hypothetical protein